MKINEKFHGDRDRESFPSMACEHLYIYFMSKIWNLDLVSRGLDILLHFLQHNQNLSRPWSVNISTYISCLRFGIWI